jgi:Rad3-related DNA helicase
MTEARLLVQEARMSEGEREAFLAAFAKEPARTQVGFAVLGGVFGEGIDLVGDRLIGVVVVGVGLPQISLERDLIADRFNAKGFIGYDYAYRFPGFNRVLQAAGRVIRSERDRGFVLLIDRRFNELRYRNLFPAHWSGAQWVKNEEATTVAIASFWKSAV